MDTLTHIQATIGEELKVLNNTISEHLSTSNELINNITQRYLQTKGKQLRPILIILCARMLGKVSDSTINAAAAIELMHNASLIHDDVVDNTMYRRGNPTINAIDDNRIAVLMGDHFVSCALQCALLTRNFDVIDVMGKLGRELAHGEIDQINNMRTHLLSEEAYFEVIRRKTASLFRACMRVGAITTNATPQEIEAVEKFGELLGLCFQIKDDIFDYYEDTTIGKPTGNDIREGKITLPLLYALTYDKGEENEKMRQLITKSEFTADEIKLLIEYAKAHNGIEYAYDCMQKLRNEAVASIEMYREKDGYDTFISILDYTIARKK